MLKKSFPAPIHTTAQAATSSTCCALKPAATRIRCGSQTKQTASTLWPSGSSRKAA
jgi:hypothetical protein